MLFLIIFVVCGEILVFVEESMITVMCLLLLFIRYYRYCCSEIGKKDTREFGVVFRLSLNHNNGK